MSKIIKTIEKNIKMPNSIVIGDPYYFEDCPERTDLVYNRVFENKKEWLGYIVLKEEEEEFEISGETHSSITYVYNIILAPNEKKLELYKKGECYSYHKQEQTTIGVDTARYYIEIGDKSDTINTGGDGYWGDVVELYKDDDLDGVMIDMAFPGDLFTFDDVKKELEYLFSFKF